MGVDPGRGTEALGADHTRRIHAGGRAFASDAKVAFAIHARTRVRGAQPVHAMPAACRAGRASIEPVVDAPTPNADPAVVAGDTGPAVALAENARSEGAAGVCTSTDADSVEAVAIATASGVRQRGPVHPVGLARITGSFADDAHA